MTLSRSDFEMIKTAIDYSLAHLENVSTADEVKYQEEVQMWTDFKKKIQGMQDSVEMRLGLTPNCTCNNCKDKDVCEFAFDLYNTNGDCLAVK